MSILICLLKFIKDDKVFLATIFLICLNASFLIYVHLNFTFIYVKLGKGSNVYESLARILQ